MKNDTRTSLEKSHSAWSNTKLTFICTLASLGFSGFFSGIGLINLLGIGVTAIILLVSIGLAVGSVFLLRNFKR